MYKGEKDEVGKIEYHYGFYGAVHVEYELSHVQMEYLQEHELGDEPVRMDMLILKQDRTPLSDPIGSFFKTHNVLDSSPAHAGLAPGCAPATLAPSPAQPWHPPEALRRGLDPS